ncbi:MAG: hypothetical protein ACR2QE_01965 [Acidimicrobiales bacterium]
MASADGAGAGRVVDRNLVARLAEVGLDFLEPFALTHLGYLHQVIGQPPQLILRRPCLDQLDPTTAYRLLGGLDRAAGDLEHTRYAELDGAALCFVPSRGPHSAGVHLFGTERPLETSRRNSVENTCQAVAQVVHQLHREIESTGTVEVTTRPEGDSISATAVLTGDVGARSEGQARAADEATAVARAVVAARGNGLAHRTTRTIPVDGGRHAALTVLADRSGRPRLGFTLSEAEPSAVAASATLRAIEG